MSPSESEQSARDLRKAERKLVVREVRLDPEVLADKLGEFSGYVGMVANSIALQQQRIRESEFDQAQLDMVIVMGALRNLIDAAEGLRQLGVPIAAPLDRFMSSGGPVKNARDVFVHRSDYILGTGNLQIDARLAAKAAGESSPDTTFNHFYGRGGDDDSTIFVDIGEDLSVELGETLPAALTLAGELLDLINDALDSPLSNQ